MKLNRTAKSGAARGAYPQRYARLCGGVPRYHKLTLDSSRLHRPKAGLKIKPPGFTLIEMLLAVAIFSIVLLAMNAVFYSALHLERTTNRALDERLPLNQALAILRRDLQGAVQPNSNGVFVCDFISGAGRGGLGSSGAASTLEFCTTTGVIMDNDPLGNPMPWGDLQRVRYQLVAAADRTTTKGMDLVRVITRNLLPTLAEETDEQWLLDNVESLEFLTYTGTDWRDSWDTTMGDPGLPQAVRVRIQLAANEPGNAAKREPLELLVPLTTQARTNQTAAGGTGG